MREADGYYRVVLDAVPLAILVVEEDVRIVDFNAAARKLLSEDRAATIRRRGGDALRCVHASESPEGCGRAPYCADCVIRNSVNESLAGQRVDRRRTKAELLVDGATSTLDLLITTAPFTVDARRLVLLVLEDVSEIVLLRGILPICARCKSIRDDEAYWSSVESYFGQHLGVDFSHGLCPKCARELYPEIFGQASP